MRYCGLHHVTSYRSDGGCPQCETDAMKAPKNHAQLYDRLQELFGLSLEPDADEPYFKTRIRSASALKRQMARRGMSFADAWLTARWCADNRVAVRSYVELLDHYRDARDSAAVHDRDVAEAAFQERLQRVLDREVDQKEAARLMRAVGDLQIRERVLTEWESKHGQD